MNTLARALFAGAVGALTTNLLHEATRRVIDVAPRVDVLGMQALAKILTQVQVSPPTGKRLYRTTLLADLASNSLYFALTGFATGGRAVAAGTTIGIAAGAAAIVLPKPLGLAPQTTNRTPLTGAITIALYGLGGFAAGYTQYRLTRAASETAGSNGSADSAAYAAATGGELPTHAASVDSAAIDGADAEKLLIVETADSEVYAVDGGAGADGRT